MNKVFVGVFLAFCLLGAGTYLGYRIFAAWAHGSTVDSQVVVQALRQEGFLVTQAYTGVTQTSISSDTGSVWKDFFWGQDITATAKIKVSAGVDMQKIGPADVVVDSNSITVYLPSIETQSVEVLGDISLVNKQGVLKRIFDNNDGYNIAFLALREAALKSAATPDLVHSAQENTLKQVAHAIDLLHTNKSIHIEFKK